MKKRKGTEFVKELPKGSGRIVSMINYKDGLYIASETSLFYLSHPKTRFTRCKFAKEASHV